LQQFRRHKEVLGFRIVRGMTITRIRRGLDVHMGR
jgi:hypothetical protein